MKNVICILFSVICILFSGEATASNAAVSNVSLNVSTGTATVEFDLSQANTFTGTDANGQNFYDRIWVFVKFWKNDWATDGTVGWGHATLTSGGTVTPTSDGKGAFCQVGTSQTVKWNFAADGLAAADTVKVRVMAIEMVYIPQGSFYVGDGSTGTTARFKQGNSDSAYEITSEGEITVGTTAGNLYYGATGGDYGDGAGPIPAAFPKGYDGFYIMKYEISQGEYCDFLNTLTSTQAGNRIDSAGNFNSYRNFIKKSADTPPKYGCDAGDNAGAWGSANYSLLNEADDGENVACNYLSWADGCAYADWAGLRPLTELEFEKAARGGGSAVVAGEYAWGSTDITNANTIANSGANNEGVAETGNGLCNYGNDGAVGPLRCGFAATSSTTRAQAAASYYGVMELSGNLWERPVTVGHATGRSFTCSHGNGALDATGNATNGDWPGTGATGAGFRGGSWDVVTTHGRVSDRNIAARVRTYRDNNYGGRCARTSP